jgi:molecular chaperone HscB
MQQAVERVFMKLETIKTLTSADPEHACWSCGDMRAAQFCGACGKVQPPAPVDYFNFFGLPRKLNLDVKALEKEFYALSRKLHPDVYARAGEKERLWSEEQSSHLNDAYRTLKDPIKRTEYLLKLEGVELEEQSKAATEEARNTGSQKKQVVPPALLEEVFELNMQLEEMRMGKKMGERDEQLVKDLENQKQKLEKDFEALTDELKTYWHDWDKLMEKDSVPEEERIGVRGNMVDLLNRRSYYRNLVRDVNEALEN